MASCIEVCEAAFIAAARDAVELPEVIHLDVPEAGGEIHVKAGHIHGFPRYAVKVASGFASPGGGTTVVDGLIVVFDATDGRPLAFLLDDGYITDLRTGAAGGIAARHLAPERVERVAVIGTGGQARAQVEALAVVRPGVFEVRVWGRSPERAEACVADLRGPVAAAAERATIAARVAGSVREAVEDAEVVITCTASREPLVSRDWLATGAHVTAVGSDGPGKQELDPAILEEADLVVADSVEQCSRLGELQHARGAIARARDLGSVCAGEAPGRSSGDQLTVCDLTGLGIQDVAAASQVVMHAEATPELGSWIDL